MFLDETIDPDIPTDPNEFALYKRYGRNWRNVVMGSTTRDRGGNFDRGMRFMHSTPEGFMSRPNMQSTQQVQQGNIDQSGFFAQMQKLQDEYNKALQDYYSYMSTPQYNQMQDYYAGNYQDYYGSGGESQDNPYSSPPVAAPDTAPAAAPAAPPPPVLTPPYAGVQSSTALTGQALQNARMAQDQNRMQQSPNYGAAPAAPASAPAAPTLNSFIPRYDRDESSPVVAPVKTAAPVKTVVKPATSVKKVKAI